MRRARALLTGLASLDPDGQRRELRRLDLDVGDLQDAYAAAVGLSARLSEELRRRRT